jgi:hypothetical protein
VTEKGIEPLGFEVVSEGRVVPVVRAFQSWLGQTDDNQRLILGYVSALSGYFIAE